MSFVVIIPARYASTRLPGKLLMLINDKSIIEYAWEKAVNSGAKQVVIATDSEKISQTAHSFGAEVCMTTGDHVSGTDRLAEVVNIYDWPDTETIVNLQGDEPLMPEEYLIKVAQELDKNSEADAMTLAIAITDHKDIYNPNVVKVVWDKNQYALYFSRATIPFTKEQRTDFVWYRHLGIYAYRAGFLKRYAELDRAPFENMESLEQLRVLWHGFKIQVAEVSEMPGPGVDTPEDFARLQQILS